MKILLTILISSLSACVGQLSVSSEGVDYTNGIYYTYLTSEVRLLCTGGSGGEDWKGIAFGNFISVPNSGPVRQETIEDGQQLVLSNLTINEIGEYQCTHSNLPTVSVTVREGVKLSLTVLSSTSIKLNWVHPTSSVNAEIADCCIPNDGPCTTTDVPDLSSEQVTVTDLRPFTEYECSIRGMSAKVTATTFSDIPSGPPANVVTSDVTSQSFKLSWNIPEPSVRNGIITSYTINCSISDGQLVPVVPQGSSDEQFTKEFESLSAFTMYSCSVAASTANGTGPFSDPISVTTLEGPPGPVTSIEVRRTGSPSMVEVQWSPPVNPNGRITGYLITYGEYESSSDNTKDSTDTATSITGLEPGVPYIVNVKAETSVGFGTEGMGKVFFSEELRPLGSVSGISVQRGETSMMVSWNQMSLSEARGFPFYFVYLYGSAGSTGRTTREDKLIKQLRTNETTATFEGLDPDTSYSVQVQPATGGGNGTLSDFHGPNTSTPPTAPLEESTSPTVPIVIGVVFAVLILLILGSVGALIVVLVCIKRRQNKPKPSGVKNSKNNRRSLSTETRDTLDVLGSTEDLVYCTKYQKNGPGTIERIMLASPTDQTDGEIVPNGEGLPRLNHPITPDDKVIDEDEQLIERIERQSPIDPTKEKQYVNLLPPVSKINFTNYVRNYKKNNSFEVEFSGLPMLDSNAPCTAGTKNLDKNRYRRIAPYDHTRVVLTGSNDYINASYIKGWDKKVGYIAAQGPREETVGDFWQMILDNNISVVVMLTKFTESGKIKCHQYWKDIHMEVLSCPNDISVTLIDYVKLFQYERRVFKVKKNKRKIEVTHFHFVAWPDHGVPRFTGSVIKFIQMVRKTLNGSESPLLVHCSAGVGRSGTYIAIDSLMQRLQKMNNLNIYEFVYNMRGDRPFMVQNLDQYIFVHDALSDYITAGDTSVPKDQFKEAIDELKMERSRGSTKFEEQFQTLGLLSSMPSKEDLDFATKNMDKNRYEGRSPYKANCLWVPGRREVRYINASLIEGFASSKNFIALQAPLPSTVDDVFNLVVQRECTLIVNLCSTKEIDGYGIARFWPDDGINEQTIGTSLVSLLSKNRRPFFDVYDLQLVVKSTFKTEEHQTTLMNFHNWSETMEPDVGSVLEFLKEVANKRSNSKGTTFVMCNDGMGRTGTFICLLMELERLEADGNLDIFQTIKAVRGQRPYMVSTLEQYIFMHEVLLQVAQPNLNGYIAADIV